MLNECADLKNALLSPGKEFTTAQAKDIVNDICDHCQIDTNDRFHNTFFHEICPLLLIAEHVGGEETSMIFSGASSRFDGLIFFNKRRRQKVELTAAIDGHHDALRMELLAERGYAPAFQKIQASGTRRNRTFGPNETEGGCTDEYDHGTLLPLLGNALTRKVEKSRKNRFYFGAWLGAVFDDWICPLGKTKKKKRFDPLCRRLLSDGSDRYAPFSRVFIIGISRQYLFDSCEA
jgi:hypothetical protein